MQMIEIDFQKTVNLNNPDATRAKDFKEACYIYLHDRARIDSIINDLLASLSVEKGITFICIIRASQNDIIKTGSITHFELKVEAVEHNTFFLSLVGVQKLR